MNNIVCTGGESSKVSASSSLDRWKQSEAEEEQIQGQHQNQNQKKSVLTKVKEKAKKLRHTLSGKKKHDDANLTLTFADDEPDDEDTEYLGAPSNIYYIPFFPLTSLLSFSNYFIWFGSTHFLTFFFFGLNAFSNSHANLSCLFKMRHICLLTLYFLTYKIQKYFVPPLKTQES